MMQDLMDEEEAVRELAAQTQPGGTRVPADDHGIPCAPPPELLAQAADPQARWACAWKKLLPQLNAIRRGDHRDRRLQDRRGALDCGTGGRRRRRPRKRRRRKRRAKCWRACPSNTPERNDSSVSWGWASGGRPRPLCRITSCLGPSYRRITPTWCRNKRSGC